MNTVLILKISFSKMSPLIVRTVTLVEALAPEHWRT